MAVNKKKKKKKEEANNNTQIRHCCMRHLVRTYTVWKFCLLNLGPTNRVNQNKKEEEENRCVQAMHSFITLSLSHL